jgi:hypothetical protein
MLKLPADTGSFNDVSVICSDGRFTAARAIPEFYVVLAPKSCRKMNSLRKRGRMKS